MWSSSGIPSTKSGFLCAFASKFLPDAAWPGNSCRMANDATRGVGNSSAQTVDDHVLVNGRTRKRSAAGGWSEAEVCAEKLPLRWRPCMEENAAASGSCYWLGAPMRIGRGAVEDRGKRESQQAPARKATCRKGAASGSNLPAGSTIGKQLPAGVIGRMA